MVKSGGKRLHNERNKIMAFNMHDEKGKIADIATMIAVR